MQCSFCPNPAAHPATGCQYTPTMLACHECVVRFWTWARQHTRGRKGKPDFYEAAGRWAQNENRPAAG